MINMNTYGLSREVSFPFLEAADAITKHLLLLKNNSLLFVCMCADTHRGHRRVLDPLEQKL